MKYEWRKQDKEFYLPKNKPEQITLPRMNFLMLDGRGNPNSDAFAEEVGVLYALSYAIKMMPKKGIVPPGYFDYTVFPLEGVWDLAEEARGMAKLDKNSLVYTLMIRQPDFVTAEWVQTAVNGLETKVSRLMLDKVKFQDVEEGPCVQMMHLGSYDNEPESFRQMEDYCQANDLARVAKIHREIYLSDARKVQPEKLRTVLRFQVSRV